MPNGRKSRLQLKARDAVRRLQEYHPPPEGRDGKIRLDFNENTVGCAPGVIRAFRQALNPGLFSLYPEYEEGRAVLARYFGVSPQEMLITNGVDDAIKLICDTFVEPGDVLLTPAPTFAIYKFFHDLAGGKTESIIYDLPSGSGGRSREGLQLAAAKVIEAIKRRTRWMALANPNNPTGTLVPKNTVRSILEAAPRVLLLVDEAYFDFSGQTILPWIRRFPNLIVSRSFSKAFGLAGLRIGFLFANRELAGLLRRAHAVFAVNSAAMACAVEAVRHEEYVRRYAEMVCKNRALFCRWLDSQQIAYAPSAANFVLVRAGRHAPEVARSLRQENILVRDWPDDPQLHSYLRFTIGTAGQMKILMNALKEQHRIERRVGAEVWRDLTTCSAARYFT